jgi:hypothetical protein
MEACLEKYYRIDAKMIIKKHGKDSLNLLRNFLIAG